MAKGETGRAEREERGRERKQRDKRQKGFFFFLLCSPGFSVA